MARSLGLTAYRAFVRRKDTPADALVGERPEGELVWIHAGEPENLLAIQDLALRLMSVRVDLSVLITVPENAGGPMPPMPIDTSIITSALPGEHSSEVKAFLDHWQPDTCIWTWGGLRPNLVTETAERDCPMFLIDADVDGFEARRDRWIPDLTRQLLSRFQVALARSAAGRKRLLQLGMHADAVSETSALLAGGQVLRCEDSDLDDLSAAMGGRPAWFASGVTDKELPIVLSAHKKALRLSHRLLLILQPEGDAKEAIRLAAERNMITLCWDEGQYPDETAQLLITSDTVDRGLFFRVAPVTFLGGTLVQTGGGSDPLEAAALGSAVLYGARVRRFMPSYSRLVNAGAARIVNDADALGTAVSRLIAPDQAATMAHAGWDVISQGAALTDRVVDLLQDVLDKRLRNS